MPVVIPVGSLALVGELTLPVGAKGVVIFAHGSGSGRHSQRNRYVASVLQRHLVGTLLIDLLTEEEELIDRHTAKLRFNIPLLTERLSAIGAWVNRQPTLNDLPVGYFGASTGGGAALIAAAHSPQNIAAVVSRGGRPDLAMDDLPRVSAPVLLLVGEKDPQVLQWNIQALEKLNTRSRLDIIPAATHLFEESGTLEEVAQRAAQWFAAHF